MKRPDKRITKALIRRYFGSDARVRGFCGHYRVTTRTGGEVMITQKRMKIVFGLDDTYRAVTLLAGECWGGGKIRPGSREFMLGMAAHGEAENVNIQPNFKKTSATIVRWCVAAFVLWLGIRVGVDDTWVHAAGLVLGVVFIFEMMKQSARREEQRKAQEMGFHYPRVHGTAGAVSRDDLEREGWV